MRAPASATRPTFARLPLARNGQDSYLRDEKRNPVLKGSPAPTLPDASRRSMLLYHVPSQKTELLEYSKLLMLNDLAARTVRQNFCPL